MIILDTETTGLPNNLQPLSLQPYIIEFAALKVDFDTLEEHDRISFLCKPPIEIPEIITKITGITGDSLKDEKPFAAHYLDLVNFFLGETILLAHNASFDVRMIELQLIRLDRVLNFPWPWRHICTAETTMHLNKNKYFKQEELYEYVTGKPANQTHRAMDDVTQLWTIAKWLRKQGLL